MDDLRKEIEFAFTGFKDPDLIFKEMRPYTDQALSIFESEAKERAPDGANGELRMSITHSVNTVRPGPDIGDTIGAVFIQPNSPAVNYAFYVEKGRGPGTPPPVASLIPWATRNFTTAQRLAGEKPDKKSPDRDAEILSFAFAVARSIGKKGTHAQHFMERGFEAQKDTATRIMETGLGIVIEKLNAGTV